MGRSGVWVPRFMPPQTITDPPPYWLCSRTVASTYRSPCRRHTRIRPSLNDRVNLDSSENRTLAHCCRVQVTCWRAQARRRVLLMADRMGRTAGLRDLRPASRRRLLTVLQLTLTPVVVLRRPLKVDAVVALSRRAPILRWRSCCLVVARGRPERGLSWDNPVATCRSRSLIMTE